MKSWSKERFGNIEEELKPLKEEISKKEKEAETTRWEEEERDRWVQARKRWLEMEEKKNSMERQKAKVKWIVEGDENSKLFHAAIKYRERKNNIRGMNINSIRTDDPSKIKKYVFDFFKEKFSSQRKKGGPRVSSDKSAKVSREEAEFLERPFSEKEIWMAVKDCGGNKAPGPDGFTFAFIKRFWGIIKDDLSKALHWFWEKEEICWGCNLSFLTLIPKAANPSGLGDFRPISLGCGG